MQINKLCLENFRNYKSFEIELFNGINVISGENAQGKTNLLEAIFLLSCGHGFKTRFDRELISFEESFAKVQGDIFSNGREQSLEIALRSGFRKTITCNKVKKTASDLPNILRTVVFCPEDLNLLRDGAVARRRFLDIAISSLRPQYGKLISNYTKLLDSKRKILKDHFEKPSLLLTLPDFNESLGRLSAEIIRYRSTFIKRLEKIASPIHSEFSSCLESLNFQYKTVSTVKNPFASVNEIYEEVISHQKAHYEAEIRTCSVLTGIHKDDLEIFINGRQAKNYASQGQTRTAALSLKMAERELSIEDTGEIPILLLDDVLSELDSKRQDFVLNRISKGQTLISCCEDYRIKEKTNGKVFMIKNGNLA